jgi:hypothetical protein
VSETPDNLTSSDVRRLLSVHARTMRELADRAAEAVIAQDLETAAAYVEACEEEAKKMVALTRTHLHLLRRPS